MRNARVTRRSRSKGVLIIVENLPVPLDRRVWSEATALREAGYTVSVICPKGKQWDSEPYIMLDGIAIYRYPLPPTGTTPWSFAREYWCALLNTARLSIRAYHERGFQVIQSCNPPDFFFLISLLFLPFDVRFVFDHHDLTPELFKAQFGDRFAFFHRMVLLLERCTFRAAHTVITTNLSLRDVAIRRGGVHPSRLFVVRNGPNTSRLHPPAAGEKRNLGYPFVVTYLGVMGPQDGVDLAIRAADIVVNKRGRRDVGFIFIGDGDAAPGLRELAAALHLGQNVRFLGRLPDEELLAHLGASDVCLCPDPANGFNELHTMNKVMEYMALGRAIVAFDLAETRYSAGSAALYAAPNDVQDFAAKILELLSNPAQRALMGQAGLERIRNDLSWDHSRAALLAAYAHAFEGL